MTLLERPGRPPVVSAQVRDLLGLLVVAVLAGLVLGVGDLVWMDHVAEPWAGLANSSAVWAVAAFGLGAALRVDAVRGAVAGVVTLLVAVEAYYGYAAVTGRGEIAVLWSSTARTWLVFAVLAGAAFGAAGAWTTVGATWQRVLGAALGAGVLGGEALHTLAHLPSDPGGYGTELTQTALAMTLLAVVLLAVVTRRPLLFVAAALVSLPVALFCAAAFTAAGIAY